MNEIKNIIIIGAGASCEHSKDMECPPLGKDLAKRMREDISEFREVEKIVGECEDGDFEKWMDNNIKNTERIEPYMCTQWCLSKYFSKYTIQENTKSLYLDLIDKLGTALLKETIFISLNYEILLELALFNRKYNVSPGITSQLNFFNNEQNNGTVVVLKPHGSSNYHPSQDGRIFGTNIIGRGSIVYKFGTSTSFNSLVVHSPDSIVEVLNKTDMSSVVCAYEPTKQCNIETKTIDKIRDTASEYAKNCRSIVLVGIRYQDHDKSINDIVKTALDSNAKMIFVSPEPEEESFNGYKGLSSLNNNLLLKGTFEEKIDDIVRNLKS